MRKIHPLIIAASLPFLLTSCSAYADDACTEALNKAIARLDRSIQTYSLKSLQKTFTDMSDKWKEQSKTIPATTILLRTVQLQHQLDANDLTCISNE